MSVGAQLGDLRSELDQFYPEGGPYISGISLLLFSSLPWVEAEDWSAYHWLISHLHRRDARLAEYTQEALKNALECCLLFQDFETKSWESLHVNFKRTLEVLLWLYHTKEAWSDVYDARFVHYPDINKRGHYNTWSDTGGLVSHKFTGGHPIALFTSHPWTHKRPSQSDEYGPGFTLLPNFGRDDNIFDSANVKLSGRMNSRVYLIDPNRETPFPTWNSSRDTTNCLCLFCPPAQRMNAFDGICDCYLNTWNYLHDCSNLEVQSKLLGFWRYLS